MSFSSNILFSCILLFSFEKYGLYAFQNGFELQSALSFSKYDNLASSFRFEQQVLLSLKLDNVTRTFWLICLVFETWSDHYLLTKENICFSGTERCKLMQLTIFLFWGFFKKSIICRLGGILQTIKPSWRYAWFDKYHQATCPASLNRLCSYTNRLLEKDSSNFVSAMHKISLISIYRKSESSNLFLMELIFRYENITLLRWECCNRLKVKLIFSLYSWLVVDVSIRGPIYLLNMLSTRS